MHPVVLFPVAIMVALVFTLIAKRCRRGSRRKAPSEKETASPSIDVLMQGYPGEIPPGMPSAQESPSDQSPGASNNDDGKNESKVSRVAELEAENTRLKEENLKLKMRGQKKAENLAGYHEGNKNIRMAARKRRQSKLASPRASPTGHDANIELKNKRTGKPKGRKGGGFKAPKEIDREVEWRVQRCPHCGRSLKDSRPVGKWHHVIIDIVELKRGMQLERVRHVIYRYRCPGCHHLVSKDFGRYARIHYGIGLISFVMEQRLDHRVTWEVVRKSLFQFFAGRNDKEIIPTIVSFIDWMERWEPQVRQVFDAFRAAVKNTSFAHVDETGVPMDGKNHWLWVVVTGHVILYLASESRGHETIEDLFDGYKGILISDFWTAYNCLDAEQQKCLAHLVKDLKVLECKAIDHREGVEKKLAGGCKETITAADDNAASEAAVPRRGRPPKQPEPLSDKERTKLAADVEQQAKVIKQVEWLREFFGAAWKDGDMSWKTPVDKRISRKEAIRRMKALIDKIRVDGVASPDIERLLKRMEKFAPKLFTYLDHPGIPPDNNWAEREIRPFVIQRKISANFVNPEVFEIYAMMLSLYHTGLKHKIPFRDILRLLHDNDVNGILTLLKLPVPPPPPPPDLKEMALA
nr:transposase [Candidatus Sigynarchaeota archaeon]